LSKKGKGKGEYQREDGPAYSEGVGEKRKGERPREKKGVWTVPGRRGAPSKR